MWDWQFFKNPRYRYLLKTDLAGLFNDDLMFSLVLLRNLHNKVYFYTPKVFQHVIEHHVKQCALNDAAFNVVNVEGESIALMQEVYKAFSQERLFFKPTHLTEGVLVC